MIRFAWVLLAAAAATGCGQAPLEVGQTRPLGPVSYDDAFEAAKAVMNEYYTVETADPVSGTITSAGKNIELPSERLISGAVGAPGSPARQQARLIITRSGDLVEARAVVAIQRQQGEIFRLYSAQRENYSGSPGNRNPGELYGAPSLQQQEVWETTGYDSETADRMLQSLYDKLHRKAPTTQRYTK
ncbi:MAG: hypothetical protein ABFD92_15690 [Planctomycetaceae bacterium]|nr:hypothetical protein [Planctomycetaceae bacterium]